MISVITPYHQPYEKFLRSAYDSLLSQTVKDWEWVLVPNKGATVPDYLKEDKRVTVAPAADEEGQERNKIGRLKRIASQKASGGIIVEYDADDILLPGALEKIIDAFKDESIVFAYSNSAQFDEKTGESIEYSRYWGWKSRPFRYNGYDLFEMIAWEPSVHMMRLIYWAPNHFRAWRSSAYWKIGGHDETLATGDDHDLCCRFYMEYGKKGLKHVDECLYLYRKHDTNTCKVYNAEIQKQTNDNYNKYSRRMINKWAEDEELKMIDLGGRFNKWPGYISVDCEKPADIITDLNEKLPFEDSSVGVIKAHHIFEHLRDPIKIMNECYRVLAPGGWLLVEVPSSEGRGACQDPTHISFWNENSFWYYTNKNYAQFIKPKMNCRFQKSRVITYFPNEINKRFNIPVVQADLIALKSPYDERPAGEVLI